MSELSEHHLEQRAESVSSDTTILVHMREYRESEYDSDDRCSEFYSLASSAGSNIVAELTGTLRTISPATWMGKGKLDQLRQLVEAHEADVVLINADISPAQERNIERAVKCRVLTRTGVILDIFAQRARSHEGKLQVELAQLEHLSTRLVRGWTHLERQKGGIGLRGPGETQLEMDRRMIGLRMKQLRNRLSRVNASRKLRRDHRRRIPIPTVSIVGYTNAGKSTLFNRLTGAKVYAADQLFATLDPTMRRLELPSGREVVLSDTVGFVRDLPHDLVNAFHSTLEEVVSANLLLHVVDASDRRRDDLIDDVDAVLDAIDGDTVPTIHVFNKIDALGGEATFTSNNERVYVAATTGAGLNDLLEAIDAHFDKEVRRWRVILCPADGEIRANIHRSCRVIEETFDGEGNCHLLVEAGEADVGRLDRQKKWELVR